jgi:hypothetical protein
MCTDSEVGTTSLVRGPMTQRYAGRSPRLGGLVGYLVPMAPTTPKRVTMQHTVVVETEMVKGFHPEA